jgi:hypothetical protein
MSHPRRAVPTQILLVFVGCTIVTGCERNVIEPPASSNTASASALSLKTNTGSDVEPEYMQCDREYDDSCPPPYGGGGSSYIGSNDTNLYESTNDPSPDSPGT